MRIIEEVYNWARKNFIEQKPDTIVIHHAEKETCTAQDIHRWHLARGWKGIAYHYFIRKDGSIFRGRQEQHKGGHLLSGENNGTLGICLEGNYDKEKEVPEAQFDALIWLCGDIATRRPIKSYKRHSDYPSAQADKKMCPGIYFPWQQFITAIKIKDYSDIAPWAKDAVLDVVNAGIMIGDNQGRFNPQAAITRQEVAVVIDRLLRNPPE